MSIIESLTTTELNTICDQYWYKEYLSLDELYHSLLYKTTSDLCEEMNCNYTLLDTYYASKCELDKRYCN